MKERALQLFILFLSLLPATGSGQDPPFAEILTADAAWCQRSNNLTTAEILITGDIDTSRFDLVVGIRGTRDTLVNLPSGIFTLYLNNQLGSNEYIVYKIIEYQEYNTLENDVNDTLIMEVHPWPDMTFNAEFETRCSPVNIVFRAREGYPTYTWDFGDGTGATTSTNWTSHTYISEEDLDEINFETGLRVETAFGCVDSVTDNITIYPTPAAGFQVSPELLFYPNTTVYLTNTTTPGSWDFKWDFGDASRNYTRDPGEHVYSTWGVYDIEMEWSTPMCRGSVTKQIEIRPPKPVALFLPDTSGCPPLLVSFRNNTLYAETYLWDFDDGTFSTEANPTHSFMESRSHYVKLVATGLSGRDSTEQTIAVFDRPVAMFEPNITETSNLREVFTFDNNSVGGVRYLWDFGDGTTSEEESPSHLFNNTGSYTITLYAWSINDCTDTLVMENLVTILEGEGSSTFPNAFKWNGSGPTGGNWTPGSDDNTVFHPDVESATALRMVIFSRLGHKIFETNEVYVGWDGYINSSNLALQGVYIYKAWITYSSGEQVVISGDVTFLH
ncbi:MAG: PKD domain-containing protein [Bacteroidales bacterium]|nr:PKD domain-containing protein [Bacteroidales bacterium]